MTGFGYNVNGFGSFPSRGGPFELAYVVVAGGGGGSSYGRAGGGAGGLLTSSSV